MHLAFVDIAYGYTAGRPEQDTPLGGTTSALCFLARALRDAGISCTIFNKLTEPASAHGIQSLPLEMLTEERRNPAYTAFIFCGRWADWLVAHIAETAQAPLIAWMHESSFGGQLVPALPQFKGVAFVSDWQARVNQPYVPPGRKQAVIRNAMGPWYESMFAPETSITALKTPLAVYIGATPRGLLHLPGIWPQIHAACPELELRIFANPAPTADPGQNAAFAAQLRAMPGVSHVGMAGQPRLAAALQQASFYLAPNPFPETSCIALIESMSAGLCCITTARAALPETAHGFAALLPVAAADDPHIFTQPLDHTEFAAVATRIIQDRLRSPAGWEERLRAQVSFFQHHYRWRDRVAPWTDFVNACAAK